jgi:hypothetical protein
MMALTRDEFRTEVDKNLGGRAADLDPTYTRLDRHLDLTLTRLGRKHEWKETFRLDSDSIVVTGTPSTDVTYVGLPVNTKEVYGLMRYASGDVQARKLDRLPNRQWDQLIGRSETLSIGDVTHYMMWSREGKDPSGSPTIEWYKVPDANFTLYRRYSVWPTMSAIPGGAPELINKDDLIIADCTHWIFQSLGEREEAATWYAIAQKLFEEAKAEDDLQPDLTVIPRGLSSDDMTAVTNYWQDPYVRGW